MGKLKTPLYWGVAEENLIDQTDFGTVQAALVYTLVEDYERNGGSRISGEDERLHGVVVVPAIPRVSRRDSIGLRGAYSAVEISEPFGTIGTLARNFQKISSAVDGAIGVRGDETTHIQARLNNKIGLLTRQTARVHTDIRDREGLYDFYLKDAGEPLRYKVIDIEGGNGKTTPIKVRTDGGMRSDGALSYSLTATVPIEKRHLFDAALLDLARNADSGKLEPDVARALDSNCPVMILSQTTPPGGRGGRFAVYGPRGVEKRVYFDSDGRLVERTYGFNPLNGGVYCKNERFLDVEKIRGLSDLKTAEYALPGK